MSKLALAGLLICVFFLTVSPGFATLAVGEGGGETVEPETPPLDPPARTRVDDIVDKIIKPAVNPSAPPEEQTRVSNELDNKFNEITTQGSAASERLRQVRLNDVSQLTEGLNQLNSKLSELNQFIDTEAANLGDITQLRQDLAEQTSKITTATTKLANLQAQNAAATNAETGLPAFSFTRTEQLLGQLGVVDQALGDLATGTEEVLNVGDLVTTQRQKLQTVVARVQSMDAQKDTLEARITSFSPGGNADLVASLRTFLDDMTLASDTTNEIFGEAASAELQERVQLATRLIAAVEQIDSVDDFLDTDQARQIAVNRVRTIAKSLFAWYPPLGHSSNVAGGIITDLAVQVDFTLASFRDTGVGGHDREASFFVSGTVAERFQIGIGQSFSEFKMRTIDYDREGKDTDFFLNVLLGESAAAGFYVNYSESDTGEITLPDPIADSGFVTTPAVDDTTWNVGFIGSYAWTVDDFNLGLTSTLNSSGNNSLADSIGNGNDGWSWTALGDVNRYWTDWLSTTAYATFFTQIDRPDSSGDGTFWILGGDVSVSPTDRVTVSLGYESTVAMQSYKEHRLTASVLYTW